MNNLLIIPIVIFILTILYGLKRFIQKTQNDSD